MIDTSNPQTHIYMYVYTQREKYERYEDYI